MNITSQKLTQIHDALMEAVDMLTDIKDGKSFNAVLYIEKLQRIEQAAALFYTHTTKE
jgi:hypothetical protein